MEPNVKEVKLMKKLTGYAKFPDGLIVTDEEIYKCIMKHSRFIDRLSGRKWVEMAIIAFDILNGSLEKPKKKNWKFYSRSCPYWR